MANKYDVELTEIIKKYNLHTELPGDSVVIHNILMDLFKTRCEGKKTALWGAGRKNTDNSHAAVILKKYTTYIQTMSCIIDSLEELWGDEFMGYPIISPAQIRENGIELVIISSKVQADSIKKDLQKYAPGCEVIDIYEELRQRGIHVYHKFYEESSIYTTIFRLKQNFLSRPDIAGKQKYLKMLIGAYLSIRDFCYAFSYCREYIEKGYEDADKIKQFMAEAKALIDKIKSINSLKKDDIAIFFIDSLRAMDVFEKDAQGSYSPKLLKRYLDKAVVFTNAKSTGVTTYESMISVIKQKYPFEQNVYENNIMSDFNEFELLPLAKEMGYDIRFYISEGYQIIHSCPDIRFTKQVYLPEKMWSLACDMAQSENKTFNFLYFPYELHFPLICGEHEKEPKISGFVDAGVEDTKDFVPRQLSECKAYVDRQMDFYHSFFNDDMLTVLFSDHSQVVYDEAEQKPYFMYYNNQDRCVNVTFFIKGFGLEPEWNEELVSLYDFNTIMKGLLKDKKLTVPHNDAVRYQYYKIHYKKLRDIAGERGLTDYIDGMNCMTSKDYLYMVTANKKEEVYDLSNIKENIIDTKEGQDFKNFIVQNYDTSFPDFILNG